jgi:hypothetical protein
LFIKVGVVNVSRMTFTRLRPMCEALDQHRTVRDAEDLDGAERVPFLECT